MLPRRLLNLMILKFAFSPSSASRFRTGRRSTCEPGKERLDADVDGKSALHAGDDRALDRVLVVVGVADLVPDLEPLGLLLGQDELAVFVLDFFDEDLDVVSDAHGDLAFLGHELPGGDHSLGLEADVDLDVIVVDREDLTDGDLAFLDGLLGLAEELRETRGACGSACAPVIVRWIRTLLDGSPEDRRRPRADGSLRVGASISGAKDLLLASPLGRRLGGDLGETLPRLIQQSFERRSVALLERPGELRQGRREMFEGPESALAFRRRISPHISASLWAMRVKLRKPPPASVPT